MFEYLLWNQKIAIATSFRLSKTWNLMRILNFLSLKFLHESYVRIFPAAGKILQAE